MAHPDHKLDRGLPASVEAEKTVLGAIMLDGKTYFEAAETVTADDFHLHAHRFIYAAMAALAEDGKAIDIITLTEELHRNKRVDAVGGVAYISSLIDGVPHQPTVEQYVKIVKDKRTLRQLIAVSNNIISRAMEQSDPADEITTYASTAMLEAASNSNRKQAEHIAVIIPRVVQEMRDSRAVDPDRDAIGFRTGLRSLDKTTTGYRRKEMTLLTGWTGDGKTSLAVQGLVMNALDGVPCLFFTHEMTSEDVVKRMIAATAELSNLGDKIDHRALRDPRGLDMFTLEALPRHNEKLAKWPLWLDDASNLHVKELVLRTKAAKRRHKIDLVVVDYVQLLLGDGENKTERLENVSKSLRQLAKDEDLALVVLSQMSRPDDKKKRKPQLMDLKGSGQLEQDAHCVLAAWRPENEWGKPTGADEVLALKQRNGPIGLAATVEYNTNTLLFDERIEKHRDE